MKYGEKFRYVRELRQMTLSDLSKKCELSIPYLSDIENGKKRPAMKSLERIAKALSTNSWFFLDDKAATLTQIAEIKGYDLPDEIKDFVSSADNLPYVILAKKAFENGVSADTLSKLVDIYRKEMDKS